jgi:hypothetical protein
MVFALLCRPSKQAKQKRSNTSSEPQLKTKVARNSDGSTDSGGARGRELPVVRWDSRAFSVQELPKIRDSHLLKIPLDLLIKHNPKTQHRRQDKEIADPVLFHTLQEFGCEADFHEADFLESSSHCSEFGIPEVTGLRFQSKPNWQSKQANGTSNPIHAFP